MQQNRKEERVAQALDHFAIEIPSWGFANTGTRFGKFLQAAAATTIEEKSPVSMPPFFPIVALVPYGGIMV